ncbi:MAG: hypothetical protein ILO34_08340, partial [Kiritimatiellae bacterium]|nr:hypothetical protein [Kiritimatiellia bacterium]
MDDGRAALTAGERFFAFAVGVGVALFAWLSGNSDIFPPELWDEISVAAGVRPPPAALPAFWRRAVSLAIGSFGIERTLLALRLLGPAALGALATMSFFLLAGLLPDTLRLEMRRWRWGRRLVLSVLVQGALCFAMSEPVWYVCRALTPDAANLLVAVFFVCAFRRALAHGGTWPLIAMSALAGFAAADTILAFAVPAAVAVAVALMLNQGSDSLGAQLQNPLLRFVALRRSAAVYTFALAGGVWANVVFFGEGGGPQAHSWSPVMCLLQYLYAYVLDLKAQARPIGWILMFLVCVAPLVVSARYAARATDGAAVLPYPLALFYAVTGVFLFTQSAGVPAFWFWHWVSSSAPLMSGTLLGLCLLMTSAAVTLSLCVGSVGLYCRNTAGILQLKFEDVAATTTGWRKALAATRFAGRLARAALVAEPALAVL